MAVMAGGGLSFWLTQAFLGVIQVWMMSSFGYIVVETTMKLAL
jgi:hypothetical protein